jgi:ABC-type phosphate/phosphonate transport system substrate-binding protein
MATRNLCAYLTQRQAAAVAFVLMLAPSLRAIEPEKKADPPPSGIRVGIVRSLFRDIPEPLIKISMIPFRALMHEQTGLNCDLIPPTDAYDLGDQLAKHQVELAVFQGFEFAWVREKHSELKPLIIAVNKHRNRKAHLIVRDDYPGTGVTNLKGKELAIPTRSRDHCRLFVERTCQECGSQSISQFFSKISGNLNVEEALDILADDGLQAVVVDDVALECYQRRKPGRFGQLKDLCQSEWFPDTIVAYSPGAFSNVTLDSLRRGLKNADKSSIGRQLLTLWLMTEFEDLPKDFDKLLTDTSKAYPSSAFAGPLNSADAHLTKARP